MSIKRFSKVNWFAGALALLAVGIVAGDWWAPLMISEPAADSPASRSNAANPPGAAASNGKPLYWYDPMIPNQHFDTPGKSPMGMDMVPKYSDAGSEGGGVRVSSAVVQNLGIRLGKVEKASLKSGVHAVGSVAFDERLVEVVQARVEGYVTPLNVKAPLERVHRGQPLATILAPQWLEAQQEYLTLVDAQSESARGIRDAARQRLVGLGV